ncbi:MAG TPA: acyltransferase family protein, partial [Planctomycetaceae bacterium]
MRTPEPKDRLHGFDAVRGLAAVAVVALHASYAYALFPLPGLVWPVPLDEPSRLADAAFWWIEGSVMPLFFVLSGYFLARSLARQTPGDVLAGRTRRLLLPMATVGLAVLAFDLHVWAFGLIATGRATVEHYREMKFPPAIQADLFGPAHLWYVEYLWLLCGIVCGVTWIMRGLGSDGRVLTPRTPGRSPQRKGGRAAACGFAALLVASAAVLLSFHPEVVLGFQHGWLPDPAKFAHAGVFLLLGMLLQRNGGLTDLTRRLTPLAL